MTSTTDSNNTTLTLVERYVPVGDASLADDAPGWSGINEDNDNDPLDQDYPAPQAQARSVSESKSKSKSKLKGPICWKCRGTGRLIKKTKKRANKKQKLKADVNNAKEDEEEEEVKESPVNTAVRVVQKSESKSPSSSTQNESTACTICDGTGYLPPKQQEIAAVNLPGQITRIRACPPGWKPNGPEPFALRNARTDYEKMASNLVGSDHDLDVFIGEEENYKRATRVSMYFPQTHLVPVWLPRPGEQLCNLVGHWRILQRVASHRWTTDDLVTSYMAGRVWKQHLLPHRQPQPQPHRSTTIRYLDLGCGNGSVLLMTIWQFLAQTTDDYGQGHTLFVGTGIEARSEAVDLARRSIALNVGNDETKRNPLVDAQVHHGDFRSKVQDDPSYHQSYDLITGTPPYFQVDFTTTTVTTASNNDKKDDNYDSTTQQSQQNDTTTVTTTAQRKVQKATIHQGGMPTCKQSAPARCEFRGGVEAYCQAAAYAMHDQSIFVVCENWLNDKRVYQGAAAAGLVVVEVLPVMGRQGKPSPLFAVYVMRKKSYFGDPDINNATVEIPTTQVLDPLIVRDRDGNWTEQYKLVLQQMSIPVV